MLGCLPCTAYCLQTASELLPSMDELLGLHVDLKKVRKIGEGEPLQTARALPSAWRFLLPP